MSGSQALSLLTQRTNSLKLRRPTGYSMYLSTRADFPMTASSGASFTPPSTGKFVNTLISERGYALRIRRNAGIGSLGDTCIAIPAFRLIRSAYPRSEISVLTNFPVDGGVKDAPLEAVIGKSALVDRYIEYPVGLRSLREFVRCVRRLRAWDPDILVYLMPLRTRFQLLRDLFFFKAIVRVPEIIGFSFDRSAQAHEWDEMRQAFEGEAHRLVRNLATLGEIDLSSKESWDLGLRSEEIEKSDRLLATWEGTRSYIACSIGAKWSSKDWGQDRWEEL